jgi:hypothetical protein
MRQQPKWTEARAKRQDCLETFYGHYAGPKPVVVPPGMMAVTVGLKYDNSECMADYFDPHASVGPVLVLAVVMKQAQTERLARQAVAQYPELAGLEWEWHTEKWANGHGNYLDGPYIDLPEDLHGMATYYGQPGSPVKQARWQVQFNGYSRDLRPFRPRQ